MRKKDPNPVEIASGYYEEGGLFFTDLDVTIFLEKHQQSDYQYLTPDFGHLLISRESQSQRNVILDVSLIKKEANDYSKTISRHYPFKYIESSYEGITSAAKWDIPIRMHQNGDVIKIINQDSYYQFNLKTGEVIDLIKLLGYNDGWGLTRIDKNLNLIEIESRKQSSLPRILELIRHISILKILFA
ncbi:MAG: hypothetical protein R8G66_01630 [Cytophagales bacterium]|nr:hypothetical protein [Cytophagales bacterium]